MNDEELNIFPFYSAQEERARRWRLVLGKGPAPEEGEGAEEQGSGGEGGDGEGLSEGDKALDESLEALYGDSGGDEGGFGDSAPDIARWLGDIRNYFPAPVVRMMQQDALKKLNLRKVLNQPELLAEIEPDVNLVATLLSLKKVMNAETRETARQVVRQVVEELQKRLEFPLRQAIAGSLNRSLRTRRPKAKDINWGRTIYANLKHYQPEYKTVVPETLVGYGRKRSALRDVILAIDTSGSMAQSVVYASICGAVMASIETLATKLVMFDTSVVDLSDELDDPVEMLFGIRLGGGTNIGRALTYCQQLVTRPRDTILVLLTDLYEGGGGAETMLKRTAELVADGVQVIVLLALNDQGAPRFNRKIAQELVDLGVPSFACTPDLFPDLMGAAINGRDIRQWAATHDIVTAPSN
jgi:Mg-chelatase subunit ChlD